MKWLYPRLSVAALPMLARASLTRALIAGIYGVLHDQFTYSVSREYFTKLKFTQFAYARLGLPDGGFVMVIGFLATWWVGLVAGWLLARAAGPDLSARLMWLRLGKGFGIVLTGGLFGGAVGFLLGLGNVDLAGWQEYGDALGVSDLRAFVRVAYIHNASYLGGFLGLVAALRWTKVAAASRR